MKAIISSYKSSLEINDKSLLHSETTMKQTWNELREVLANNTFMYRDTEAALNITFLKQFNEWFHGIGKDKMTVTLSKVFQDNLVGRGSKLKADEKISENSYSRFMPISKFIKDDNRFSPAGVEWLYLAIGKSESVIMKCAEKECRTKPGDRFGFCKFNLNNLYKETKLVDLTIADKLSYEKINKFLRDAEERERKKSFRYAERYGFYTYKSCYDHDGSKSEIIKWILYMYAKMLSKNIFVPIKTTDKKLEYAPFQILAMYFIKEGFDGIIYSSTVYPEGKNIVLFNKNYATPYGEIKDYTVV